MESCRSKGQRSSMMQEAVRWGGVECLSRASLLRRNGGKDKRHGNNGRRGQ